MLVSFRSL